MHYINYMSNVQKIQPADTGGALLHSYVPGILKLPIFTRIVTSPFIKELQPEKGDFNE